MEKYLSGMKLSYHVGMMAAYLECHFRFENKLTTYLIIGRITSLTAMNSSSLSFQRSQELQFWQSPYYYPAYFKDKVSGWSRFHACRNFQALL